LIAYFATFLKISFVCGSYKVFFSGINLIQPLLSMPLIGSVFAVVLFFKYFIFSKLITLGLPTLISSLCWAVSLKQQEQNTKTIEFLNFLLKAIVPAVCMILFVCHPEGSRAYLYSFYWFIPMGVYFLNRLKNYNSYFLTALTTTFVAHAVGSVIWLYVVPMTSVQWLALIPLVAIERLVFACGISLTYILSKNILGMRLQVRKIKSL